jgi:hypothetical protein
LFIINPDRARPDLVVVTSRAELLVERRSFGPDLEGCLDANRLAEIELRFLTISQKVTFGMVSGSPN